MTTPVHNPDHYPHKDGGNADTDILCRACELGVPARRSMPGPPDKYQLLGPTVIVWKGGAGYYHHPEGIAAKRLSDAECAAEMYSAIAGAYFVDWAPNRELGIEIPADGQLYEVTRPDPGPAYAIAEAWHRFATTPHFDEATP